MLDLTSVSLNDVTDGASAPVEPTEAWTADMVAMMVELGRNWAATPTGSFRWTGGAPFHRVKVASDTGMSFSVSISDGDVWQLIAFVPTIAVACGKAAELLNTPDGNRWWATRPV